jgi:hypothetical protein
MDRKTKIILAANLVVLALGFSYVIGNAEDNTPEVDPECTTPWKLYLEMENTLACENGGDIEFYYCDVPRFSNYHGWYTYKKRAIVWCYEETQEIVDQIFFPTISKFDTITSGTRP